jgi:hypothetical protein
VRLAELYPVAGHETGVALTVGTKLLEALGGGVRIGDIDGDDMCTRATPLV